MVAEEATRCITAPAGSCRSGVCLPSGLDWIAFDECAARRLGSLYECLYIVVRNCRRFLAGRWSARRVHGRLVPRVHGRVVGLARLLTQHASIRCARWYDSETATSRLWVEEGGDPWRTLFHDELARGTHVVVDSWPSDPGNSGGDLIRQWQRLACMEAAWKASTTRVDCLARRTRTTSPDRVMGVETLCHSSHTAPRANFCHRAARRRRRPSASRVCRSLPHAEQGEVDSSIPADRGNHLRDIRPTLPSTSPYHGDGRGGCDAPGDSSLASARTARRFPAPRPSHLDRKGPPGRCFALTTPFARRGAGRLHMSGAPSPTPVERYTRRPWAGSGVCVSRIGARLRRQARCRGAASFGLHQWQ